MNETTTSLRLVKNMHAVLYEVYSAAERRYVKVGERAGTYGPESYDGAEYKCLASGPPAPKGVPVSRDYKAGAFYPDNTFVVGQRDEDDQTRDLTHDELLPIMKQLGYGAATFRRVLLPDGMVRGTGKPKFQPALMFTPVEMQPYNLEHVYERMKRLWPSIEGYSTTRMVEVFGIPSVEVTA